MEASPSRPKTSGGGRGGSGGKLRGLRTDSHSVQLSKTLSWILRHGAKSEGLAMRADGYVKIDDLVRSASFDSIHADLRHH